jgi:hypothetical protein
MFVKVFSHINPPTLFEVINYFSMIDGHIHHIMKVLEDSTPHLHTFDFSIPCKHHALKTCQTKVDGNLVHTPYNLNRDTYAIKSP